MVKDLKVGDRIFLGEVLEVIVKGDYTDLKIRKPNGAVLCYNLKSYAFVKVVE